MTTTDTRTADRPRSRRPATTGADFVTAALQNAKRTILQFFRTPQLLMLGTVQGALFLFMFRYIFGGAINPGGGLDYVDFLVPGFLVTGILWLGMPASSGVAEDATTGVHDRLRSLADPRSSVMFGRSIADTALTLWGLFVTGVLAFIVGFRLHSDALDVLLAVALLVVMAYSVRVDLHHDRPRLEQRAGGERDGHAAGDPGRVHLRGLRPGRLAARLAAAHRQQPTVHDLQQRVAQLDARRHRRGRSRPHARPTGWC